MKLNYFKFITCGFLLGLSSMSYSTEVVFSSQLLQKAQSGDAEAQLSLAEAYIFGRGVEEDEDAAEHWALQSAAQGNAAAMYFLGDGYSTYAMFAEESDEEEAKAYYAKGVEWLQKAADLNHAEAMGELADLYIDGNGVAQSDEKAFALRAKAATLGYARAMRQLAYMYEVGKGTPVNLEQSAYWIQQSEKFKEVVDQQKLIEDLKRDKETILKWQEKTKTK